jgi:hypothetical protein
MQRAGLVSRPALRKLMNWAALASMGKGMARSAWASQAGRRMIIGAGAGAAYGAMSDNTSVLGGAAMGAVAGRYTGAGLRRAALGYRGIGVASPGLRGALSGFGKGVTNTLRMDYRGARMLSNRGIGKMRGIYANWAVKNAFKKYGV